jgi:subtilase family serine protease
MNRSTGAFYPSSSLSQYDNVAVKFEVENKGGQNIGYWSMRAELPTENNDHQIYGPLTSLAPGQKTEFTLGFDNPKTGNQIFTIKVDHNNNISESNESNNTASRSLHINR